MFLSRHLKFGLAVVISELLLIGLAIAWLVHMVMIAMNGSVYFVEKEPLILWGEITATALIIIFAASVLGIQLKGLGERRSGEDRDRGG